MPQSTDNQSPFALVSQDELTVISNALTALMQQGKLSINRYKMAYDLVQEITHASNLEQANRRPSPLLNFKKVWSFEELADDKKQTAYEQWQNFRVHTDKSYDDFVANYASQEEFDENGNLLDIPF